LGDLSANCNVAGISPLVIPRELKAALPATPRSLSTALIGRHVVRAILRGEDPRFIVITGPCSIHDPAAALEYAQRLRAEAAKYPRLYVLMRVYFEKPRTVLGWKGLINDPHLDGSFDMAEGLRRARRLLIDITDMELPAATEMLDPVTPQYLDDLVSWVAIGARTTESQTHRQMASGLSAPVGFKNGTDGTPQSAIDAIASASHPHHFLGVDEEGRVGLVATRGNEYGHLVLRGGRSGPNCGPTVVAQAAERMHAAQLAPRIIVDCSHANAEGDYRQQPRVFRDVVARRAADSRVLVGAMLESNLHAGRQAIPPEVSALAFGVSITDACIDWETTAELLAEADTALRPVA
jgi:3-deoxy-7-phosphoheptulonate synthase